MKGLIRNNFYTVEGSLKLTLLISILAAVVLAVAGKLTRDSGHLFSLIIGGNLGGFGALSATAIQKDAASKWDRLELTMPVSRTDVVTARYLSCMFYIFIGVIMALLNVLVYYLAAGTVNLERMSYGFVFGLGFALSLPTFIIPLTMIFGADKNESLTLVAIFAGLALFVGARVLMTPLLTDAANADFVFRAGYVAFSVVLFGVSYLLSCWLYRRKEL